MLLHLYLPKDGFNQVIDFTDIILEDVMMTCLADKDIPKKCRMGKSIWENVNETIGFIKAKEMARDAMTQPAILASVTSYKSFWKTTKN